MKKTVKSLIAVIFAAVFLFLAFSSAFAEEVKVEFDEVKFGDINEDGKRTADDARLLLRCSVGLEVITDYILIHGDYDKDSKISAEDARMALRVAVCLESASCILKGHELMPTVIEPTCTAEGYTTNKCSRCSFNDGSITDVVPVKGHTIQNITTDATCISDGIFTSRCLVCGFVAEQKTVSSALGHRFGIWEIAGAIKSKTCKHCGFTKTSDKIKTVYLTFDDGPGPYTEKLLGYLREYNVKATFFVTNQMSRYRYLLPQIVNDGHAIGVHSLTHQWSIYSSTSSYLNDFNAMHQIILDDTGVDTKIFRFPGGTNNTVSRSYSRGIMNSMAKIMTDMGYTYYDWNVDCYDTLGYSSSRIASSTINQIKGRNTSIVLMHDIKNTTVEAVKEIIRFGLDNGYEFAAIDESTPLVQFSPVN